MVFNIVDINIKLYIGICIYIRSHVLYNDVHVYYYSESVINS